MSRTRDPGSPPPADAATRSVWARASVEARVPSGHRRGKRRSRSPVASGRRCRTGRELRRRPRPPHRRLRARGLARSGRGGASSRATARGARRARRHRRSTSPRSRSARSTSRSRIDSACLRSSERSGSTSSSRYRRPKASTSSSTIASTLGTSRSRADIALVEPGPEVVDVEEADAFDLARLAVDVSRHREIDDDQRAASSTAHRSPHRLRIDDRRLGRGRRDGHVSPRERVGRVLRDRAPRRRNDTATSSARAFVRLATTGVS